MGSSSSEFNGVGCLEDTGVEMMEFPKSESTSVEEADGAADEAWLDARLLATAAAARRRAAW
jgi:hypothetical protein